MEITKVLRTRQIASWASLACVAVLLTACSSSASSAASSTTSTAGPVSTPSTSGPVTGPTTPPGTPASAPGTAVLAASSPGAAIRQDTVTLPPAAFAIIETRAPGLAPGTRGA